MYCSCLANESHPTTSWATGGVDTWSHLKQGFKQLIKPFASLAEKGAIYVS